MKFDFPDESVITEVADNKIIFSVKFNKSNFNIQPLRYSI